MFVYIPSEAGLFTVGHYAPRGKWVAESDWPTAEEAARRVRDLNGGNLEQPEDSIIARVEREFSTRWAQENPQLFADRLADFFTTYTKAKGYMYTSDVRDGFMTVIAETHDERARGESIQVIASYEEMVAEKYGKGSAEK